MNQKDPQEEKIEEEVDEQEELADINHEDNQSSSLKDRDNENQQPQQQEDEQILGEEEEGDDGEEGEEYKSNLEDEDEEEMEKEEVEVKTEKESFEEGGKIPLEELTEKFKKSLLEENLQSRGVDNSIKQIFKTFAEHQQKQQQQQSLQQKHKNNSEHHELEDHELEAEQENEEGEEDDEEDNQNDHKLEEEQDARDSNIEGEEEQSNKQEDNDEDNEEDEDYEENDQEKEGNGSEKKENSHNQNNNKSSKNSKIHHSDSKNLQSSQQQQKYHQIVNANNGNIPDIMGESFAQEARKYQQRQKEDLQAYLREAQNLQILLNNDSLTVDQRTLVEQKHATCIFQIKKLEKEIQAQLLNPRLLLLQVEAFIQQQTHGSSGQGNSLNRNQANNLRTNAQAGEEAQGVNLSSRNIQGSNNANNAAFQNQQQNHPLVNFFNSYSLFINDTSNVQLDQEIVLNKLIDNAKKCKPPSSADERVNNLWEYLVNLDKKQIEGFEQQLRSLPEQNIYECIQTIEKLHIKLLVEYNLEVQRGKSLGIIK